MLARPKPLNIQALPFQPQSVMIPPSSNSISDQLSSHSVSDRPSNHTVSDQPSSHTVSDQSASHSAIVQPSNVTVSGKTGLIAHLKVSRNVGFKYSVCCSWPMVVATHTKFSHVSQQFLTFLIIH